MRQILLLIIILNSAPLSAQPGPGDIFREYLWKGPWVNADGWQRVTDPGASAYGAREFLPNPVNTIVLDDLEGATRAEIYIEQWGGHAGTSNKSLRLNDNPWISIPEPEGIPNGAGVHADPECYQYFSYPSVSVPLEQLRRGENSFEFTCSGQICYKFGWGQWGVYGVAFRIYYDDAKPHTTGRIVDPAPGAPFGDSLRVFLEADAADVEQVDFIGFYEDFDYEGNGLYRQWHAHYRRGEIVQHLGTATAPPYAVTWKTDWVPDQDQPVRVMARMRNTDGIYYMTETVDDLHLRRENRSVQLYKPFYVPGRWQTRAKNRHYAHFFLDHDLSRAAAAQMILTTWAGKFARAIGLNDSTIVTNVGDFHRYSYDEKEVPLHFLHRGTNQFFTYSTTFHHGIEVLWPGIVLKVQYAGSENEIQVPTLAQQERIYADELSPHWKLEEPRDLFAHETIVDLASSEQTFQGEIALGLESPQRYWELKLSRNDPLDIRPYRALRFAFKPHAVEIPDGNELEGWLRLYINEPDPVLQQDPVLLTNDPTHRVDMDRLEWQVVEIPLDSLKLRFPYMESLRFYGDFTGRFFIDDIHLVPQTPPPTDTAVLEAYQSSTPNNLSLAQNYPNPFNSGTMIRFALPQSQDVNLTVYNLAGQQVVKLVDGFRPSGTYAVNWDGRDAQEHPLASGLYLYRLQAGTKIEIRKLLMVR